MMDSYKEVEATTTPGRRHDWPWWSIRLVVAVAGTIFSVIPLLTGSLFEPSSGGGSSGGSFVIEDEGIPDISTATHELENGEHVEVIDLNGDGVADVFRIGNGDPQDIPHPPQVQPWWERLGLMIGALLLGIAAFGGLFFRTNPRSEPASPSAPRKLDLVSNDAKATGS